MTAPQVLLSGFSDEVCRSKDLDLQFGVFAALGLRYVTLRFLKIGESIKNVIDLTDGEADHVRERLDHYGLSVSSIGSPLGKVKLYDVDDGSGNRFRPADDYLSQEVTRCCELGRRFNTKLIRGFSFYPNRGDPAAEHVQAAADRLKPIVAQCDAAGLTFGLEVEANLVGHNADRLLDIHQRVAHPALQLIFDGANLAAQGYSTPEILEQWNRMRPALGWLHVKDYRGPDTPIAQIAPVDEDALNAFVPVGWGTAGYKDVFRDVASQLSPMAMRLSQRSIPGLFVDLEPHLISGGQFGGYSSPAGFGVAVREFCKLADATGLPYSLRAFSPTKM